MNKPILFTLDEAADILRVSTRTLYRERNENRLTVTKIGGCVRVTESELRRYINDQAENPRRVALDADRPEPPARRLTPAEELESLAASLNRRRVDSAPQPPTKAPTELVNS